MAKELELIRYWHMLPLVSFLILLLHVSFITELSLETCGNQVSQESHPTRNNKLGCSFQSSKLTFVGFHLTFSKKYPTKTSALIGCNLLFVATVQFFTFV